MCAFAVLGLFFFIGYEDSGQCKITIAASGPLEFCRGDAIQTKLTVDVADAKSYQWLKDETILNASNKEYVANAAGKYEVKMKSKNSDEYTSNTIELF